MRTASAAPRSLLTAVAALVLGACTALSSSSSGASGRGSSATVELTVFAAASLGPALEDAAAAYGTSNPGVTITLSTDSSAALRTQIEQGAPADLFLSADSTNPQALIDAGLAHGDAVTFAANRLAVIVPPGNPAGIRSPADLARAGVKIVAAGEEVPITRYAAELVDNLARVPGYPARFAASYAANIVSREDNVSAVAAKVTLGEADAAIVYETDARAADVQMVAVPETATVTATYAGVVVKASPGAGPAGQLLDWLAGPSGQAFLAEFGFLPPPPA